MLPDLLQHLRCPVPHEDSWLVATALIARDRRIIEGTLGCPVCHAEYAIHDGVVAFPGESVPGDPGVVEGVGDADRLGALLGFSERGGLHVLHGAWGALAGAASDFAAIELLLVEPPPGATGASAIRGVGNVLPLAAGCARGVALDRADGTLVASAVRVLGAGGRLVVPSTATLPDEIKLLARDDRHWVGERLAPPSVSAPVTPRRAAPRTERR